MEPQAQGLEDRLVDLEAQMHRLADLTDQCAGVLQQWSATGERQAKVVHELEARLTSWNEVEARLQHEAQDRFQALERVIEHEWASLRHLHEEPVRQLQSQAESLTEICVTTAGSAQTGLERAEARLATLESDLHRRMDELATELHAAVAEIRHRAEGGAPHGRNPWSLDEVTRLHDGLRDVSARASAEAPRPMLVPSATPAAPTAPPFAVEGDDDDGHPAPRVGRSGPRAEPSPPSRVASILATAPPPRSPGRWYAAVGVLAATLAGVVVVALMFYREAGAAAVRASEAQQHADQVATAADQRIEAARQDAASRIAQARDTASKAQVTSDVLAAPDLIRFNLAGGNPGARFSAQLLLSRSRGLVFSGSRLPAPPAGSTYQIWLVTATSPVSAGTFVPDKAGRVTTAIETLPDVPRPITDVRVTLEPQPGRAEPSGTIVLARTQ